MNLEKEIVFLLHSSVYPLLECRNVSHLHSGHAGHNAHSHFELIFEGHPEGHKELFQAHKAIYALLRPIYPSQIHSISLFFRQSGC